MRKPPAPYAGGGPKLIPSGPRFEAARNRQADELFVKVLALAREAVKGEEAVASVRRRIATVGTGEAVLMSRRYLWAQQLLRDAADTMGENAEKAADEEAKED